MRRTRFSKPVGMEIYASQKRDMSREFLHDFSTSKRSVERQEFHQFTFVEGWKLVWLLKKLYCIYIFTVYIYVKKNREIYLCLETHVFLLYLLVEIWWTCQHISSKDSANLG